MCVLATRARVYVRDRRVVTADAVANAAAGLELLVVC
jgi:hypothetical protein